MGSALGVDIGFDLLDFFGIGGVLLHLVLHSLNGVENGGVVPVVKDLSDVHHGEVCHGADEIHGDLPRSEEHTSELQSQR